jgi:tetratricopeptide (TPR) repeat protein
MIVTEKFVFIHMHKTGGQSLNDIIERCIPDHRVIGYHYPRAEIPPEFVELPVVGFIRNPWDWYVSWYAFNRRPKIHNQLFNVVSDGGSGTFKSTIANLIHLGSDRPESKQHRDDLIRMLPNSLDDNRAVGLAKDSIRDISNAQTSYYSWLSERMLGNAHDDQTLIGRFENLQDDFLAIMKRLRVKETESLRIELDKRERKNVSRHSHYSHYYGDELRDLVARKERGLIKEFDYNFVNMKPSGVAYEFPANLYTGANQGFRKLLGRESNFLQLNRDFDVGAVRNKIERIPAAKWSEFEREKLFAVHKDTQSILLVHFEDLKHEKPEYRELYFEMQPELKAVIDYIAGYYQNNGFIVRLLLAKLLAGGKIPNHTDAGYSLLNCHRVHIPVITDDKVVFVVGGEEKNMQVGEFWEINNGLEHAVENRSDEDRIHLIVDWMPNYAGKSEEEVLTADQPEGRERTVAVAETLNAMVAQAHQLHRSGQPSRAESLYRQVLHMDGSHVLANNLLGLLCLQTKRFDEAANYIERALAETPDDAQAHSNLGLALKDLNRPEEAAKHFHESLKLVPNNPRTYNNLGSVYVTLGRIKDAITCFQQALAIQPAYPEVHFNLGNALLYLQRYSEAAASLQQCLVLKPDFAAGRTKLEQALQGLRNQESAPT